MVNKQSYGFNFREKRSQLVEKLIQKGIKDTKVLRAIGEIPRELFVEEGFINRAYDDTALPIRNKQTISQPYTVAYMTEMLEIRRGDRVLEIGTGSGYQSAILYNIGARVYTIERISELIDRCMKLFKELGITVKCFEGDGTLGLPNEKPFDRIIITAASPEIPINLAAQLASGGRMVAPVGSRQVQTMYLIQKNRDGTLKEIKKDRFKFVPLIGKYGWDNG